MPRYIDISCEIKSGVPIPPGVPQKVKHTTAYRGPYSHHWQATWLELSAHTGTHVDSPLHVVKGAPTVGAIDFQLYMGEAVMLDVTSMGKPNAVIKAAHLEKHEKKCRAGDIIVVRTDWGRKMFGTLEYYTKSPYIDVSAAKWLVARKPKAIAFDFFEEYDARRTDFDSTEFKVHHVMLGAGVVLIEGLDNLDKVKKERFFMMALPIKIADAEAAPARAIAIVD
ncbi:MAG: cyclase family protein [Candidatus Tectomicrobia bacterium]|uniref:Cyclase family protein n=1 Tax=Tectimicrobiota bacterium TaxID=2528274 RepID=A0A932I3Y9_UNCTE|nr:cyclase family protein [Candidatus Tectomicrobia bacterium]